VSCALFGDLGGKHTDFKRVNLGERQWLAAEEDGAQPVFLGALSGKKPSDRFNDFESGGRERREYPEHNDDEPCDIELCEDQERQASQHANDRDRGEQLVLAAHPGEHPADTCTHGPKIAPDQWSWSLQDRGLAIQRPSLPFLAPPMALDDGPSSLLDSGPLYAGANVTRISDIRAAAQIVDSLTP
jgi:hypothetical protein